MALVQKTQLLQVSPVSVLCFHPCPLPAPFWKNPSVDSLPLWGQEDSSSHPISPVRTIYYFPVASVQVLKLCFLISDWPNLVKCLPPEPATVARGTQCSTYDWVSWQLWVWDSEMGKHDQLHSDSWIESESCMIP